MSFASGSPKSSDGQRTTTIAVGAGFLAAVVYLVVSISGGTAPGAGAVFGGVPRLATATESYQVLENSAYVVGYDNERMDPLWACYRVFQIDDPYDYKRPSSFRVDKRTSALVSSDDYKNTGYTRGHMAPNDAIMTRFGQAAQLETFMMSNVTPQKGPLNSGPWQSLEALVKDYAQAFEEVWVVTGPIFASAPAILQRDASHAAAPAPKAVQIPESYFEIIIDVCPETSAVRTLSLMLPQTASATAFRDRKLGLRDFICSINEIEEATGIDFLWELEDRAEEAIESQRESDLWALDADCG